MNIENKELFRLAALAVGMKDKRICQYMGVIEMEAGYEAEPCYWNPLEDDAEAFRLAVDLNIVTRQVGAHVMATVNGMQLDQYVDECRRAATRRVIVRAAALIGGTL